MITRRPMNEGDEELLAASISKDEHHKDTMTTDFFKQPGDCVVVSEDEHSPICFARYSKSLRVDVQFMDNHDRSRNAAAIVDGFQAVVDAARVDGYKEIVFTTNSQELATFCFKTFKYEVVDDLFVLRKQL